VNWLGVSWPCSKTIAPVTGASSAQSDDDDDGIEICGYHLWIHLSREIACVCHNKLNFEVIGDLCFG